MHIGKTCEERNNGHHERGLNKAPENLSTFGYVYVHECLHVTVCVQVHVFVYVCMWRPEDPDLSLFR